MKRVITACVFLMVSLFAEAQSDWLGRLEAHRDSVNSVFSDPEQSILTEEDLSGFEGLSFFPPNPEWVKSCKVRKIRNGKEFLMPTTTDRTPSYRPYARLQFKEGNQKLTLTVYQNIELTQREGYEDYLFLPFNDLTNGEDSYGGGRYLDLSTGDLEGNRVQLDFNYSYNPYCAYNPRYSCPIPPEENFLNVRVEAGVKNFGYK